MDGLSPCPPHLLEFVCKDRQWFTNSHGSEESNKLELTLGPPGTQKWSSLNKKYNNDGQGHEHDDSLLSLGHHHSAAAASTEPWPAAAMFLQFPADNNDAAVGKESSLHQCSSTKRPAQLQTRNNDVPAATEKKGPVSTNTAVPQKRTAPGPVVGWPPIRSFRKNLASTSTTPPPEAESQNDKLNNGKKATESTTPAANGLFVKINMDGIPIGRKVNLNPYDSYEKLSSAVDKLFRGLLAAQTDSFANGIPSNLEEGKPITGLLDGSGEYTLVYEDNEGDRVLVGDVPWRMFVSTVKRLRVLKTSELPSLSRESPDQPPILSVYKNEMHSKFFGQ